MTAKEIISLTALELGEKIKRGEVTSPEAAEAVFGQIDDREPDLNSFITIEKEGALKQAEQVQREIEAGRLRSPLAGVPVAVKDNICLKGMRDRKSVV